MRNITVLEGRDGFRASVRETEEPGTWELEWTGAPEPPRAHRTLRNAGERLAVTCPPDQEGMRETLERLLESETTRNGDRYTLELLVPTEGGFVHDDDDFRTPLHRVTCPTCVRRVAESRTEERRRAFGHGNGPREIARHTRLVAEAYTRLAEIEEDLKV